MVRSPMACRRIGTGWCAGALVAWVALAVPAVRAGVPYTEPDILRAFEEVALKGAAAPEKVQMLAFKYHDRLDLLRLENKISDRIFQANEANFTRLNDGYLEQAAQKNNLVFGKQTPMAGKVATPMSDTDAIMQSADPKVPMKAAQIHKANADYQRSIQQMMAKHGLSAPGAPPPDTHTSIMPDPRHMTRAEWQAWTKAAMQRGEVIYQNPVAAAAEAKMRAGEVLNAYEATARVGELQRLAADHFQAAEKLEAASRQASAAANHAQARQLQLQAQALRQNAAKYAVRIHETGQYLSGKAGLTPTGQAPSGALKQAAVRGHAGAAQAKQVAQQSQQILDQANRSFMDNMSHVATQSKDPALVAQAKRQMARALNHLPAEQRAQALEAIGKKGGAPLAREVERTMRTLPKGKPATVVKPAPSRMETAVKVLSTAAVIYQGVTRMGAVRDAKDFAERFTELPAAKRDEIFEQLTPEQREYLSEAIARIDDPVYQEQMRRAGFIPRWHTAAQSEEAGRQLGGFTGGYVGGKIGVLAGMKLGAVTGTAIGGPVGTVVGAGVGLVVGVTGYVVGNWVGTSLGDTRSGWWDHNLPDEEFNRRALANGGMEPKAIYDRLVAKGVDPQTALDVAKTYREGSLDAFTAQVRAVREVIEEIERREAEGRQREEDNRRRAEDHRIAEEFFEDAWARTERQERDYDRRVEESYQDWTEHLAGLPPADREQSMAEAGLTPEQRKELEERVAGLPPGSRVATPPPAPIHAAPTEPAARRVVYGQTVELDLGEGYRDGVSGPVDTQDKDLARWQLRGSLTTAAEQAAFDEGYGHGFDAGSLRDYWKTAPPPKEGDFTWDRWEEQQQAHLGTYADERLTRAYFMGYRLSLDGNVEGESGVRFVFQSTPTLTFDPPENANGRSRVTFERMGTVHVWAQVETTADGQTRRDETPRHAFEVAAPELALDLQPSAGMVGQEIRARVTTRPAVPDPLLSVVWSSPPSSERHQHGASGMEISVTPSGPGPLTFRAEVRAPVHGDVLGTVTGTCEVTPEDEIVEPEAPGVDAERRQQLINEGYALEQQEEWAAAIGKYQEAQAIEADPRVQARIDDLQVRIDAQNKAQQLIHEGYALEQQDQWIGAIGKYEAAVRLVENAGIRKRIDDLRLRLDQQDRAQALVNEGYALERGNDLPGAIGKYEAAVRLVDNPGIRAKIAELRAHMARQEDQVRRAEVTRQEQQRQEESRQEQARLEQQRAERERAERERAERERAERERLERQRREQEEARRREAEARRKAEEDARRRQQEEAQRNRFTGTFEARVSEGGTTVVMRLVLRQNGNRVSGTFSGAGWSENFSGSIRSDRMYPDEGEGESFAISADGQSLRGPDVVFRRVQ
jgi:hypothetical protein